MHRDVLVFPDARAAMTAGNVHGDTWKGFLPPAGQPPSPAFEFCQLRPQYHQAVLFLNS